MESSKEMPKEGEPIVDNVEQESSAEVATETTKVTDTSVIDEKADSTESVPENTHNISRDSVIGSERSTEGCVSVNNVDNSSLCNLLLYSSDDSSSQSTEYESNDDEEDADDSVASKQSVPKKPNVQDTLIKMGELCLDDLPPVPDLSVLNLEVKMQDCEHMGTVSSIVDRLVMVESLPNMPAYDIDTLLFLNNGKVPLGYVYDVIGPVMSPMYAVRFNTRAEIDALSITKGLPVFSAPKTEHTQYVFLKHLLQAKGSDASWKNDLEVPPEYADYSDDEAERSTRQGRRRDADGSRKRNSLERHRTFEQDMNAKNSIDTRLHSIRDSTEPASKKHMPVKKRHGYQFAPAVRPAFGYAAPSVPPFAQLPSRFGLAQFARPLSPYANMPFVPYNSSPPRLSTALQGVPPFRPNLPPPMPPRADAYASYANPPPPGVDVPQKEATVMHPPSMGLPAQAVATNVPFYVGPPHMPWFNYPNPPPPPSSSRGGRMYFPQ